MSTFRKFSVKRLKGLSAYSAPPIPPSNPDILWWPCDDGSGPDVSSNVGPNGLGNFTWSTDTPDSSPYSISFDTPGQYLNSVADVTYAGNKVITLVSWLDCSNWGNAQFLFDSSTDSQSGGYTISTGGDGNVYIDIWDSSDFLWEGFFTAPSSNAWHRFYFILDNNVGLARVFIDGIEVTVTPNGSSHSTSTEFLDQTLYVATMGGASSPYSGMVDDIRIYSGSVTP